MIVSSYFKLGKSLLHDHNYMIHWSYFWSKNYHICKNPVPLSVWYPWSFIHDSFYLQMNWCPLCGYKVRKNRKPSRLHHIICSNTSTFLPFGWCYVCSQEHQILSTSITLSESCTTTPSELYFTSRTGADYIQQPLSCNASCFPKENYNFPDCSNSDIASMRRSKKTVHFAWIDFRKKVNSILKMMSMEGFLLDQLKHSPLPNNLWIPIREASASNESHRVGAHVFSQRIFCHHHILITI